MECHVRHHSLSLGRHDLVFPAMGGTECISPSTVTHLPSNDALIILDWDNTLFPLTWLASWFTDVQFPVCVGDASEVMQAAYRTGTTAAALLEAARKCGTVFIVTNAERGWVEMTARQYLPDVARLLEGTNNIHVCSARTTYERDFPAQPTMWKMQAILHALVAMYGMTPNERVVNLITVGDSQEEEDGAMAAMAAFRSLRRGAAPSVLKIVRFMERPLSAQLRLQLDGLLKHLTPLVTCNESLRILVEAPPPPSGPAPAR
eukprot:TRINITY_DN17504_c0_g1_i1.p1 TRINITY_DN17504_c0_g1~~TRINITY_DN17504_c0_g1_i1.p1  ORF type:complete len:290 (-),score=51.21 TRINITY_DN17504_c0_g1_i1:81-863(-)